MTFLRISNYYTHLQAMNDIKTARDNFVELQRKEVTGHEINSPKDDPVGMQQILQFNSALRKNEQYTKNIDYSVGLIEVASSTLETISDILFELKGISQEYSSDTATSAERSLISITVESLLEEMVQLANTKYLGKFVFGGTNTLSGTASDSKPFNLTEDANNLVTAVTRNSKGIDNLVYREMQEGKTVAVNLSGSAPFMPGGEGSSSDIFQIAIDLRDHLLSNDKTAIAADMDAFDRAMDQVNEENIKLAVRQNSLEAQKERMTQQDTTTKGLRSSIQDVDYAELIIQMNTAETVLQTTLQSAANLLQMTMLNFL